MPLGDDETPRAACRSLPRPTEPVHAALREGARRGLARPAKTTRIHRDRNRRRKAAKNIEPGFLGGKRRRAEGVDRVEAQTA